MKAKKMKNQILPGGIVVVIHDSLKYEKAMCFKKKYVFLHKTAVELLAQHSLL